MNTVANAIGFGPAETELATAPAVETKALDAAVAATGGNTLETLGKVLQGTAMVAGIAVKGLTIFNPELLAANAVLGNLDTVGKLAGLAATAFNVIGQIA